jgi:hypothetical protein
MRHQTRIARSAFTLIELLGGGLLIATTPSPSALSAAPGLTPPVNVWLQDCVRLAASSLCYRIDRQHGNRPYFWFDLQTSPPSLQHDY